MAEQGVTDIRILRRHLPGLAEVGQVVEQIHLVEMPVEAVAGEQVFDEVAEGPGGA